MDDQSLASSLTGIAAIAVLAWLDPKRRRVLRGSAAVSRLRKLLFAALVAPGLLLIAHNRPATFVVWIGIVCASGWAVAQVANLQRTKSRLVE